MVFTAYSMSQCSNDQISLKFFYTEPHPPTNLSAVVQCKQGYEIQIDWQVKYDRK